jgi:hypothetical protein
VQRTFVRTVAHARVGLRATPACTLCKVSPQSCELMIEQLFAAMCPHACNMARHASCQAPMWMQTKMRAATYVLMLARRVTCVVACDLGI